MQTREVRDKCGGSAGDALETRGGSAGAVRLGRRRCTWLCFRKFGFLLVLPCFLAVWVLLVCLCLGFGFALCVVLSFCVCVSVLRFMLVLMTLILFNAFDLLGGGFWNFTRTCPRD